MYKMIGMNKILCMRYLALLGIIYEAYAPKQPEHSTFEDKKTTLTGLEKPYAIYSEIEEEKEGTQDQEIPSYSIEQIANFIFEINEESEFQLPALEVFLYSEHTKLQEILEQKKIATRYNIDRLLVSDILHKNSQAIIKSIETLVETEANITNEHLAQAELILGTTYTQSTEPKNIRIQKITKLFHSKMKQKLLIALREKYQVFLSNIYNANQDCKIIIIKTLEKTLTRYNQTVGQMIRNNQNNELISYLLSILQDAKPSELDKLVDIRHCNVPINFTRPDSLSYTLTITTQVLNYHDLQNYLSFIFTKSTDIGKIAITNLLQVLSHPAINNFLIQQACTKCAQEIHAQMQSIQAGKAILDLENECHALTQQALFTQEEWTMFFAKQIKQFIATSAEVNRIYEVIGQYTNKYNEIIEKFFAIAQETGSFNQLLQYLMTLMIDSQTEMKNFDPQKPFTLGISINQQMENSAMKYFIDLHPIFRRNVLDYSSLIECLRQLARQNTQIQSHCEVLEQCFEKPEFNFALVMQTLMRYKNEFIPIILGLLEGSVIQEFVISAHNKLYGTILPIVNFCKEQASIETTDMLTAGLESKIKEIYLEHLTKETLFEHESISNLLKYLENEGERLEKFNPYIEISIGEIKYLIKIYDEIYDLSILGFNTKAFLNQLSKSSKNIAKQIANTMSKKEKHDLEILEYLNNIAIKLGIDTAPIYEDDHDSNYLESMHLSLAILAKCKDNQDSSQNSLSEQIKKFNQMVCKKQEYIAAFNIMDQIVFKILDPKKIQPSFLKAFQERKEREKTASPIYNVFYMQDHTTENVLIYDMMKIYQIYYGRFERSLTVIATWSALTYFFVIGNMTLYATVHLALYSNIEPLRQLIITLDYLDGINKWHNPIIKVMKNLLNV